MENLGYTTYRIELNNNGGSRMSLLGVLTVILLVLKLLGLVSISWWIVFTPIILGVVINIVVFTIFGTIFGATFKSVNKKFR